MGTADALMLNGFRIACRIHGREGLRFLGPATDEAFDVEAGNRPEETIEFTVTGLVGPDGGSVLAIAADAGERVYTVAREDFVDSGKQYTPCEGWRVEDPKTNDTWWVKPSAPDDGTNGVLWRVTCSKKR